MTPLAEIAPAFIEMAHSIVWASVATVDRDARPRSRILHPIWEWDGTDLVGWVATSPTPIKHEDLALHPEVSVSYWTTTPRHLQPPIARRSWFIDDETRIAVWDKFTNGPPPVGYDPAIISRCGATAPPRPLRRTAADTPYGCG